jgi:hypothetical protein
MMSSCPRPQPNDYARVASVTTGDSVLPFFGVSADRHHHWPSFRR